jgi:hypothetical protein
VVLSAGRIGGGRIQIVQGLFGTPRRVLGSLPLGFVPGPQQPAPASASEPGVNCPYRSRVMLLLAGLDEVVSLIQRSDLASRRFAPKIGFREGGKIEHAGLPHTIYRLALA